MGSYDHHRLYRSIPNRPILRDHTEADQWCKGLSLFCFFPTDLDEISNNNGNRLLLQYLIKFNNDQEYAANTRDERLERLRLFTLFSLNVNCGLSVEEFGDMIKACGFMKNKRFQKQLLNTFFIKHDINAKIEVTHLSGAEGRRCYTRLDLKCDDYHANVHDQ